jgi:hypothetical protein
MALKCCENPTPNNDGKCVNCGYDPGYRVAYKEDMGYKMPKNGGPKKKGGY